MTDHAFRKLEVETFLERLAEAGPTPGGGSAAALSGAAAAALLEMVAGVSQRKKDAPEGQLESLMDSARGLRMQLSRSMEDDAEAYAGVDRVLKLPNETAQQKEHRRQLLQQALQQAAQVPLDTARSGLQLLELADELLPLIGKQLVSDLSCAVHLATACVRGGLDNVDANALSIRDEGIRDQLKEQRVRLEGEAQDKTTAVLSQIDSVLSAWR